MAPSGLVCLAADKPEGGHALGESINDSPGPQRQITSYADLHMSSYADTWSSRASRPRLRGWLAAHEMPDVLATQRTAPVVTRFSALTIIRFR